MVTINIHQAPSHRCDGCRDRVKAKDAPAPPIDDTIPVPRPPSTGDWCMPASNGQLADPPVWVPR